MAGFSYQVQAAAPATHFADISSPPIHHHDHPISATAQQYQLITPGFPDVPASSSSCFPYYNYSPYPLPYYDSLKAQESRGSVDNSALSPPPSNQQQASEEAGLSRSASQESVDGEKKRRQGKQGSDEATKKMKKQRKCGGGRRCNTNKRSTDAGARENDGAVVASQEPPQGYIHVRARRGQATDSHSLAERVRREKISARMKLLQDLVPGCDKVTGKALMLDEIINYVQSLQHQVEFLSMKLASLSPVLYDFGPDLDDYMAQIQKVDRPSPSTTPMRPVQTGGHVVVQTSAAATAAAAVCDATNSYTHHPVTTTLTEVSSVVPYLLHGCHPASLSYPLQDSGSSSLMQVVGGDSTQQFLQQLQFAASNNLCSFE